MYILEGVAAILVAVGLYVWAYGRHHAPAWAKGQLFASVMSLILVALAPLGAGLVAFGLTQPLTASGIAGVILLTVTLATVWRRRPQAA